MVLAAAIDTKLPQTTSPTEHRKSAQAPGAAVHVHKVARHRPIVPASRPKGATTYGNQQSDPSGGTHCAGSVHCGDRAMGRDRGEEEERGLGSVSLTRPAPS